MPQEMSSLIERQVGPVGAGVPGLPGSSSVYIRNIGAFTLCSIYDGRCVSRSDMVIDSRRMIELYLGTRPLNFVRVISTSDNRDMIILQSE